MEAENIFMENGEKIFLKERSDSNGFRFWNNYYQQQFGPDLNRILLPGNEAGFILKVNCSSMEEAGISAGDLVIVGRNKTPANGKIVIAELNGEVVIRYYNRTMNKLYLAPASNKLSTIEISGFGECKILGVVQWVVKAV